MKLKKKLILSCAALAACATTLVSSTFAWYTSNKDVSASSVSGLTEAAGDSLLLISDTGNSGDWGATTTFDDQATAVIQANFTPVAWDETNSKFVSMEGADVAQSTAVTGVGKWLSFDLYFATGSTAAETVYVKNMTIANANEASLPEKTVLSTTGMGTDWETTKGSYTIDLRRAITVTTATSTITEGQAGEITYDHYGFTAQAAGDDYTAGMNAHEYRNAVLGGTPIETANNIAPKEIVSKASGNTAWSLGQAPVLSTTEDSTALKVTFYVWLNGWDLECFDAVQGQSLTIALEFTSDASSAAYGYTTA